MRRLDLNGCFPTMAALDAVGTHGCYVRLSDVYRTHIQIQLAGIQSFHQLVFDSRIQVGVIEIRDASDGHVAALIENCANPSECMRIEETANA